MPIDGLVEGSLSKSRNLCMLMVINADTSRLSTNNESEHDNKDLANAVARLRAEARQTMANTSRGLRDVTGEFSAASSQLVAGQLVKDEFFTLFEAVGALEASLAIFFTERYCSRSPRCNYETKGFLTNPKTTDYGPKNGQWLRSSCTSYHLWATLEGRYQWV